MPMTAPILTLQLLQQQKDALPLAQRQVIDVILRDPGAAVLATVEQLAAQAGVSMPTIVRMCRRFGFDSVREFMVALAQTLAVSGSHLHRSVRAEDPADAVGKMAADFFPAHVARQHHEDDTSIFASGKPVRARKRSWPPSR